jgi:SAM-dependent methyltransferase
LEPSPFVSQCLGSLPDLAGKIAVDIGCGYGRNALAVSRLGLLTYALDVDHVALRSLRTVTAESEPRLVPIRCDFAFGLPLLSGRADLVMAIQYPSALDLAKVAELSSPGGFLILETFGGQGRNWRSLPHAGEVRRLLAPHFSIQTYIEGRAGPAAEGRCTVKAFARRKAASTLGSAHGIAFR